MIPKKIWQTWKKLNPPKELENYVIGWKIHNPEYEYALCTDKMCREHVLSALGKEALDLYDSLPLPVMRADFWRVLVLYEHGGIYCDLDLEIRAPIESILDTNSDLVVIKDLDNIANFFIASSPKHPVLKICLSYMLEEAKTIIYKDTQSFGMHSLHRAYREYYKVIDTDYPNNNTTKTLSIQELTASNIMFHHARSGMPSSNEYTSWRDSDKKMQENRKQSNDILFFTTFNKSGFDLYGHSWIKSFIKIANYYPSIKAKIYYEGSSVPDINHPNIEWVDFKKLIPQHSDWKNQFLKLSNHDDYVKTMTVKFSYKSFVIQHVLDTCSSKYVIWLDGDCVFIPDSYADFPNNILNNTFLACQVEENWDLNHIESGILIFDTTNTNTKKFNEIFKRNYIPQTLVLMGQPYDGFVISKSLIHLNANFVNLNSNYGYGGIQSDPTRTFQHPEIKSKFLHNIGWTGKNQYENWDRVFNRDPVYHTIKTFLFGGTEQKQDKIKRNKDKLKLLLKVKEEFNK